MTFLKVLLIIAISLPAAAAFALAFITALLLLSNGK